MKPPVHSRCQAGHTLVELLVALLVGSIVIAAAYAGYRVFANYSDKLTLLAEADRHGVQVMDMITRDLRQAGYKDFASMYGPIATPLTLTTGGNCCGGSVPSRCDQLTVIYDLAANQRVRVAYAPQTITTARGRRCQLMKSQQFWNGAAWLGGYGFVPVADWLDGLELTGNSPKPTGTYAGTPQTVDIRLRLRGSRLVGNATQPIPKTYETRTQVRNVALVP